jgi:hypothetical protein
MHVICAWIGNSEPVAAKHYLQVTDKHFMAAAGGSSACEPESENEPQKEEASKSAGDFEALHRVALNKSYPTRTRTWNSRTKICCVADYTIG